MKANFLLILELFFPNWKWVRKYLKGFWVRHKDIPDWVRFSDEEANLFGMPHESEIFEVEDYRTPQKERSTDEYP